MLKSKTQNSLKCQESLLRYIFYTHQKAGATCLAGILAGQSWLYVS